MEKEELEEFLEEVDENLPSLDELGDENICIALSGGLDSTTLIHLLVHKYGKNKVKALSFDFGQRHSIELQMSKETSKRLGIEHQIIKLDYLRDLAMDSSSLIEGSTLKPKTAEENSGDPQVDTYVPFRNLQFAAITAAFAETKNCKYIAQGLNEVDLYGYWDTTLEFVNRLNKILDLNRKNAIKFIAPFVEYNKEEELILAKALSENFKYDILENTWSCYNGPLEENNFKECGKCNTCEEKLKGYIYARYDDQSILDRFNITEEELKKLKEKRDK